MTQSPGPVYGPFAPPQPARPDVPQGYGVPRPPGGPGGSFSVEAQQLLSASAAWEELSSALGRVWEAAAEGWGYPSLFGFQDTLYAAGRLHQDVNEVMVNAAADGRAITRTLARGLVEAANDFSGTDQTVGQNFRPLQDRAGS